MNKVIIIRYSEIHLKGHNRSFFERALMQNLCLATRGYACRIIKCGARYVVSEYDKSDEAGIVRLLKRVFGVHSLSIGLEIRTYLLNTDETIDKLSEISNSLLENRSGSFRVNCNRADKRFPVPSPEIAARIGEYIIGKRPDLTVDLHKPDNVVYVDVRDTANTFIYSDIIYAVNGMPVGTGGTGIVLLSGGIDSPVAAYMMAKRGMMPIALHFHSYPYTSIQAKEKVIDLARVLNRYVYNLKLITISVAEIQDEIHEHCPESLMVTLLRRFMIRIANAVAAKYEASALITGESLGQVASQTIESITVTNALAKYPVLRPLIGFDKDEIVDIARRIDTFEISIMPYEDCCTIFLPKNPAIKPKPYDLERAEHHLDVDSLVYRALETEEVIIID